MDPSLAKQVAALLQRERKLEDAAVRHLHRLLVEAQKELTGQIARLDPSGTRSQVLGRIRATVSATLAEVQTDLTTSFLDNAGGMIALGIELGEVGVPTGSLGSFTLPQTLQETLATYQADLIQSVSTELRDRITLQIGLGTVGGKSVGDVARAVLGTGLKKGAFKTAAQRADTIARTELNRVANLGTLKRLEDSATRIPTLGKEWHSAHDPRVRPTHSKADGQVVPVNEPFLVGGHKAMHPLDPDLPAEESVYCRCIILPAVPKDAAAQLAASTHGPSVLQRHGITTG